MARRQATRHSTITDVADAAGVSIKTVSRVFNDEPNVRPLTRDRVLKAAADLDYHPNVAARSLAGRRSFLIGLAYENPSPNYVVDLQRGALERLHGERYRLLVLPFDDASAASGKMQAIARASGLDGMVLAPPLCDDPATVAELEACGLPYARIAPTSGGSHAPDVAMDDREAARAVVDHLVGLGHTRIGVVRGDPSHASAGARLEGYHAGLAAHGLAADPALEVQGAYTFVSGYEAGRALLALPDRPTAIFASNDDMAAGVINAAYEAGVSVPDQLSVVGFDDSNIASVVWPRLTTIHQPIRDMAREATSALLSLIDHEETVPHQMLPFQLVIRGSTGPVPA
ncbi:LacI family DNA-binding transcriptional regulator [Sphingomonas oryzagri]|uniref:LacI family DNA-binding transcriptional regulator n=1 Tax=Sphingomonas oryzagri TaxID=3042314 RepID=A0ABT6N2M1_9SPHN|nr:LacI family DNA-binding transcriptional regulator [Sphingomonas oryzagri]MDH7639564.1 LacI family DNA-binding transcriptional regulator [Sphingomonas oryzagri]